MLVILRGHGGAGNGFRARFWSDKNFEVQTTTQTNSIISLPGLMVNHRNLKETFPLELTTPATTTPANATVNIKPKQPPALVHTKPAVVVSIRPVLPSSTLAPIVPIVPVTTWQTITTPQPTAATTTDSDILNSGVECGCGPWSEWIGECTQQCGGCGSRTRTRTCQKEPCRKTEKRSCNFKVCPEGTNFLINNGEFHILWRGCCVGLFKSGTECTALETNQNPFFKIINSLLNVNDSKYNRTILARMRGEH